MPTLKNPRHERFSQNLASGYAQIDAYTMAGFARSHPNASNLAKRPEVQARVQELLSLMQEAERAAQIEAAMQSTTEVVLTRAKLLAMGMAAYEQAMRNDHESAAVSALRELGVLTGERIERKESGGPGDFKGWSKEQLDQYILTEAEAMGLVVSEETH